MYYPKTQIETGLYSKGTLIVKSTSKPYSGPYFSTYDNKYFSGNNPNDGLNIELLKPKQTPTELNIVTSFLGDSNNLPLDPRFSSSNITYSILTNQDKNQIPYTPTPYYPILNSIDIANGEFLRYFVKKSNENIYYEINKNQGAAAINSKNYIVLPLNWIIKGNRDTVLQQNSTQIAAAEIELKIVGLGKFLNYNFLEKEVR
jgi:hypothetical protein